jgi:hypothetical protein
VVIGQRQPHLPQVAGARHAVGGFADALNRWQQQSDQHPNDRNYDEELDERKGGLLSTTKMH